MESAQQLLSPDARAWLYAKIGTGDFAAAIVDMLHVHERARAELPAALAESVELWLRGYVGSDQEPVLRALVGRIRVSLNPSQR
jgi:hypothetical protein